MPARSHLSVSDAALLLIDHQAGLMSLVQDFAPDVIENNVLALADLGVYFQLPTVLTTSADDGPNGPLLPALRARFPTAPLVRRPGEIDAWDNPDFVRAVKATGRRQLVLAGIVTDVCVAFPALSAVAEGFEVYAVTDASGTFDEVTRHAAWARMAAAGVHLVSWFAVACELQRDWRRDAEGLGRLLAAHLPAYRNLMVAHAARKVPEPA